MNNTAISLSTSDQVFATLMLGGKTLLSVCKSNFASIDEIVRFITSATGKFMGLAQLNIRNKTQGWTMSLSLATSQVKQQPLPCMSQPTGYYRQATLF